MTMIAKQCPEYKVIVVDINSDRIRKWQSGDPPIFEPGLKSLVKESLNRNLFFSDEVTKNIEHADIIFVSVNTPTKTFGKGKGKAADLQYWEKTARQILKHSKSDKIIVEKSTLPVRTAQAMERILNSQNNGVHFEVLSNPEFLAEGSAINDLLRPDRVLIGGHDTPSGQKAIQELVDIYGHWVTIESFEQREKITEIHADIVVEREGQKRIVIGNKGQRLKLIGQESRRDIEQMLETKVMLHLWVKVRKGWTNSAYHLRSLGYT